jgi:hypothetical protein
LPLFHAGQTIQNFASQNWKRLVTARDPRRPPKLSQTSHQPSIAKLFAELRKGLITPSCDHHFFVFKSAKKCLKIFDRTSRLHGLDRRCQRKIVSVEIAIRDQGKACD